ncbi:intersectin-1 isoform X4 [Lucilia sericata]|uniref:intersectin-1 isoform X4 n=1 Tax=Lucilia sericata TaxID=13632 RepID=UPI0018A7EFBE|nr:intersectin-1 isoform X4 [Lucilia sericata]
MNPATDPWVITQREKLKYQEQFKALQPQNGFVTGAQAKGFFLQSQLPPLILGQIWALADTDSDGKMNINEFSIACKLINLKLRGMEVPKALPPTLLVSLTSMGTTPTLTPTGAGSLSPLDPLKSVAGSVKPEIPPAPMTNVAMAAASVPTAAPIAPMAGAVPIVPGMVPGTLPGIVPQASMAPAAMTGIPPMQQVAGAVPVMPSAMIPAATGVPGVAGVAGMPVVTQPGAMPAVPMMPGMVPGVVPGMPGVPGVMPTAAVPGIPPPVPAAPKLVTPPTANEPKVTPPTSNPPSRSMSISERAPSLESPQAEWAVKAPAKRKYTQVFNATDRNRTGYLTGVQARGILVQSKLPQATLAQIWTLSDLDSDGRLSCDEFILAMFLCDKAMTGEKIPPTLPLDWIPPSFRKAKSRTSSVSGAGSRPGSQPSSRHASVSSQGAADDPLAGLPQTSFEDKRKENFDKGQAELDRRRKLLQDQQRKEKEERERKEREEAEKREKARLEAERKQQEELERQLQKQRELELEREEQRKRELEAKEAARKELEKQRLLEWEQARIAELNSQKQREQERVLKQKAHNTQLNVELSTLNEKIKDLSQKICETRAGVTNVKSVIDGMRSQRDTSMSDMSQLKARIKEQNAKLLQLTQERAKWDAKAKAASISGDVGQQEQLTAAFANKQIIIKQLKDKVENIRKEIESKKEDINSHDITVTEVKTELSDLITKCEELYADYDKQRTQILEMKYNKKNENVTAATSAWDTGSAWGATTTSSIDQYAGMTNDNSADLTAEPVANAVDTSGPAPEGFVKYRAVYEFSARNADEISFVPGDIIFVPLEQNAEPGWLAGEINGHTGWFPETYVEKMDEEAGITATTQDFTAQDSYNDNSQQYGTTTADTTQAVEAPTDTYNGDVEYYIAAYPYESAEAGDLTFSAGEMVMVIKKEGDWWTGTIGNRTGMFPSNYVQKADVGGSAAITSTETDMTSAYDDTFKGMRAKRSEIAQVIAPYEATSSEQLSLTRGQLIMIRKKTDSGWWEGELQAKGRRRQIGWFPATFVKVLQGGRNSGRNTPVSGSRIEMTETILDKVIALYPYKAQNDDELSFDKDDIISVLGRDEPEWWRGELNGLTGLFPSNYVGPFVTSGKQVNGK